MKIFSTRHGQTSYNGLGRILGTTDIDLNETGEQQAKELAERIAEMNCIDLIISSPMKRAVKTADTIAKRCGIEVAVDERLREWNYGEYEGMDRLTEGFRNNKVNFGVRMGKTGESLLQLSHRIYSALDDIIESYGDKTVLIVSHGGVCRVIETYFNDMTTEQYAGWFMDNCGLLEYTV